MRVRAAAHDDGDGSLRGETLIAPTTALMSRKLIEFNHHSSDGRMMARCVLMVCGGGSAHGSQPWLRSA